jgi:daunorubicin resistance ABC transporter membrane protein
MNGMTEVSPPAVAGGLTERRVEPLLEPVSTPEVEPVRAHENALWLGLATIAVLVVRDLKRFFRQKSRVLGALVQPLIFWLAIGSGFNASFRFPGASAADSVSYISYFFPGVIVMVVLFTAIFTTLSLIEDRHQGFLQAVLVAPGARWALVLGKTLGGVTIAMVQAGIFLALAPWAGFSLGQVAWLTLFPTLLLTAVGLSALGFTLAWWLDSVQGYHAVMSVLLIPAWVLSGAMFPVERGSAWLAVAAYLNPVAYSVAAVRRALYGGAGTAGLGTSAGLEFVMVLGFALLTVALGVWISRFGRVARPRSKRAGAGGGGAR